MALSAYYINLKDCLSRTLTTEFRPSWEDQYFRTIITWVPSVSAALSFFVNQRVSLSPDKELTIYSALSLELFLVYKAAETAQKRNLLELALSELLRDNSSGMHIADPSQTQMHHIEFKGLSFDVSLNRARQPCGIKNIKVTKSAVLSSGYFMTQVAGSMALAFAAQLFWGIHILNLIKIYILH